MSDGPGVRRLMLAIGLLSASVLGFEIVLLRLLQIASWHHFAFLVLSRATVGAWLVTGGFYEIDNSDALRTTRPYRDAWPSDKILAYVEERSGVEFDGQIAHAFTRMVTEWERGLAEVTAEAEALPELWAEAAVPEEPAATGAPPAG